MIQLMFDFKKTWQIRIRFVSLFVDKIEDEFRDSDEIENDEDG